VLDEKRSSCYFAHGSLTEGKLKADGLDERNWRMPLSNGVSLVHLYLVNQGQSVRMLADGGVSQDGSGSGQIVTTTSGAP